jgi:serine protease
MRRALILAVPFLLAACQDHTQPTSPEVSATLNRAEQGASAAADRFVAGRVLVKFRPGADIQAILREHGAELQRNVLVDIRMLGVALGRELEVVRALARRADVVFAEPDYIRTFGDPLVAVASLAPNDPFMGYKWDLHNDGTIRNSSGTQLALTGKVDADIDWLEAYDHLAGQANGHAIIGIIDSGVLISHEDLSGRVLAQRDFFGNTSGTDDYGHGTHVAGIAAAAGHNGKGVPGVAWGPNVKIVSAKVCGYQFRIFYGCPTSSIANGIRWAADQGAHVLNLSLGGSTGSSTEQEALQYARSKGALPICAAGNNGTGTVSFPAAFPECVAVSSTNWSDGLASYSNWGPQIQLSAPGGDEGNADGYSYILAPYYSNNTSYAFMAGTSMASPQVAGLATLLVSMGVTGIDNLVTRMESTVDDLGTAGWDSRFGHGRINVNRAVQGLGGGDPPPPNNPPTASFTYNCTNLSCSFTDTSTDSDGSVVGWSWNFGDSATSTQQNPSRTYASAGTYTVTLTVTDNGGKTGTTSQSVTVTAPPSENQPPVADFTYNCSNSATCVFTDRSSDPDGSVTAWNWSFGDGKTSTARNPSNTYSAAGTYTVMQTVTDNGGKSASTSRTITCVVRGGRLRCG